jgi:hypothetical protein
MDNVQNVEIFVIILNRILFTMISLNYLYAKSYGCL